MSSDRPTCCQLCHSPGPFQARYTALSEKGEKRSFLECRCGFVFRDPPPTRKELEEFYQKLWKKDKTERPGLEKSVTTSYRFLNQFSRYTKPGRFLDVGCGRGFYLMAAQERGWDSYGVDLISNENDAHGIHFFKGTLQEARFTSEFFNACLVSHTLSHLLEPLETLREIYRILMPGGILCAVIPNFLRLGRSGLCRKGDTLLAEQHLYLFTRETAQQFVREVGLTLFEAEEGLIRKIARPKEFLKTLLRKVLPGPAIVLWARKGS